MYNFIEIIHKLCATQVSNGEKMSYFQLYTVEPILCTFSEVGLRIILFIRMFSSVDVGGKM